MRQELKTRILAYNKAVQASAEKADDLDILLSEMGKLPPGQLKKLLTDRVCSLLAKYGVTIQQDPAEKEAGL